MEPFINKVYKYLNTYGVNSNQEFLFILGLFVFSLMGPLGIYLGTLLGNNQEIYLNLLALSIGIILHLSTTILIESNDQHKIQWIKLLPLLLGFGFALLNELVH